LKLTSWNLPWTEVDKGYLLDHAREFPVSDLARRFRRTQNAVYLLLWKNGESGKFQDGYTRRDLAGLVHVSPRKVSRWVRLGWLTLYQGRIKDRSLRRFLEGHSDEINAERLDRDVKFWLLSLGFLHPFGAVVEGPEAELQSPRLRPLRSKCPRKRYLSPPKSVQQQASGRYSQN